MKYEITEEMLYGERWQDYIPPDRTWDLKPPIPGDAYLAVTGDDKPIWEICGEHPFKSYQPRICLVRQSRSTITFEAIALEPRQVVRGEWIQYTGKQMGMYDFSAPSDSKHIPYKRTERMELLNETLPIIGYNPVG